MKKFNCPICGELLFSSRGKLYICYNGCKSQFYKKILIEIEKNNIISVENKGIFK